MTTCCLGLYNYFNIYRQLQHKSGKLNVPFPFPVQHRVCVSDQEDDEDHPPDDDEEVPVLVHQVLLRPLHKYKSV